MFVANITCYMLAGVKMCVKIKRILRSHGVFLFCCFVFCFFGGGPTLETGLAIA